MCGGQKHMCLWWLGLCLAPCASLHPGHFCISVSQLSLCLCILGIFTPQASLNLCPGHLCILGISASHHPGHLHPGISTSIGISPSQVWRQSGRRAGVQPPQLSWGAAGCLPGQQSPPALRCYHFSLKV